MHENFDRSNSLLVEYWHEGYVHIVRSSIYHLMRGEIFEIDNCTILAFGGAPSHDKEFRIKDISWWEDEVPTAADFNNAKKNLALYNNKVDFIVTHEAQASTFYEMALYGKIPPSQYLPNETSKQIQDLVSNVEYKQHYFGHHHLNKRFNFSECLYTSIQQIH